MPRACATSISSTRNLRGSPTGTWPARSPGIACSPTNGLVRRAASDDVDTVYGPGDAVKPVIFNLGEACTADLTISLQDERGRTLEKKQIRAIAVPAGRSVTRLEPFRFKHKGEGTYFIVYSLRKSLQR